MAIVLGWSRIDDGRADFGGVSTWGLGDVELIPTCSGLHTTDAMPISKSEDEGCRTGGTSGHSLHTSSENGEATHKQP